MLKKLGLSTLLSVLLLSGCGGGSSSSNVKGDNNIPSVNAGKDIVIKTNKTITIIGVTDDSDGYIVTYLWKKGETVLSRTETVEYSSTVPEVTTLTLTVTDDKGAIASDDIIVTSKDPLHVALMLHGMNSKPETWNSFINNQFMGSNRCPEINDGVIKRGDNESSYSQQTICYKTKFGAYDSTSGRKGLENIEAFTNKSGDFSTFKQLGNEVRDSVRAIINKYPKDFVEIVMIAHSRGGIAARIFLQNNSENLLEEKNAVLGLLTLGTPHKGTPLARFYTYMKNTCSNDDMSRNGCIDNWEVIDFLRGARPWLWFKYLSPDQTFDLRSPTIADLADDADSIEEFNFNSDRLPENILYTCLAYDDIRLGQLAKKHQYTIFDEVGYNIGDQVSSGLKSFILQNNSSSSTEHIGDGIVPSLNQKFPDNIETKYSKNISKYVHHTEETKQQSDINETLYEMFPNWIW